MLMSIYFICKASLEGAKNMDLSVKTKDNIEHMVDAIKEKLRMVNVGAFKADHFNEEMYEDLKDIYEMVISKDTFSISEMQAIAAELGNLRKM